MDGVIPVFPLPPLGTDHDGHLLSDTVFIDGPDVPSKLQVELVRHEMPFVNAADQSAPEYVKDWNHYVGQEPLPIGPETGLYFQKYSLSELLRITKNFCDFYEVRLLPETMVAIAKACRGTPRIARQLVEAGRAVQIATDNLVTPKELLDFTQLDADGMSRHHKAYLLAMYQFFGRERDGEWEYIAGEASLMTILRENKQGIARIERFLVESGLVDRTPQGRRLTALGIARADWCVRHGEGLNTE
jgi:hypothetical protein